MQNRFGGFCWFAQTNMLIWLFILTHMCRCVLLYFIHFIIVIIWYGVRLWYTIRWCGECWWKGIADVIIHKFWYASAEHGNISPSFVNDSGKWVLPWLKCCWCLPWSHQKREVVDAECIHVCSSNSFSSSFLAKYLPRKGMPSRLCYHHHLNWWQSGCIWLSPFVSNFMSFLVKNHCSVFSSLVFWNFFCCDVLSG